MIIYVQHATVQPMEKIAADNVNRVKKDCRVTTHVTGARVMFTQQRDVVANAARTNDAII